MQEQVNINELERRILGACLQRDANTASLVLAQARGEYFTDPARRAIFGLILDIIVDEEIPTRFNINERAKKTDQAFIIDELAKLTIDPGIFVNKAIIQSDCRQLRDMGIRHKLVQIGHQISAKAENLNGQTTDELTRELYNQMLGVLTQDQSGGMMNLVDAIEKTEQVQSEYRQADYYNRLKTGYVNLDRTFHLLPGKMTVLGGYTSHGKTALALGIANNMIHAGIPVLYISIEMDYTDIVYRMAAMNGDTPLMAYIKGNVPDIMNSPAIQSISPYLANFHICDLDMATENEIVLIMQQQMTRYPETGLIIIDYLQNIDCERYPKYGRHLQIASIARYIRSTTKKIKAPCFLLSQLSRPEKRDGKIKLAKNWDLKESGDIENAADAIILVNRLGEDEEQDWYAVVHVSKQRQGARGMIGFHFTGKHVRFEEEILPSTIQEKL